ncbi:MAG: type ISP restriction/modification enzyme [Caldimonas sp.]
MANLNIEATYAAITGEYAEFKNLCFVDTLDNVGLHTAAPGQTADLFAGVSEENVARIKRQNGRKISVVIGNPPYNANQANENDNNKNREYPSIDARIKQTYIAQSTAQKTKLYDMYARFFRWASDRLAADGVIAFVSNSSFIDARTFDGFRKVLATEFNEIRIVDLKGNARASGELRRQAGGNIFDDKIRVGVAVWFCVKTKGAHGCTILYESVRDYAKADEKLEFLVANRLGERNFELLRPDPKGNWLNVANNDFGELMPIASKETKAASKAIQERAIFKLFSLGVSTNRDEWLYDVSDVFLQAKVAAMLNGYEAHRPRDLEFDPSVKWSETLKRRAVRGDRESFDQSRVVRAAYRPFFAPFLYESHLLIDRPGLADSLFPPGRANAAICFSDAGARTNYVVLAISSIADLHFGSSIDAYQQVALYRYDEAGTRIDNITDWSLAEFRKHYQHGSGKKAKPITKEAIFHYVYAVLHDPLYREKYAQNLKREFPRVPLYGDSDAAFWQWAGWGAELMALHIGYESIEPCALTRTDVPDAKVRAAGQSPKPALKADKEAGRIVIDSETTLAGVPPAAWRYQLGNRCAIEWVLDQHKEKKPKDPTIREKFDTYRLKDHKERVIDLLARVTTVSVETVRIVEAMKGVAR